MHKLDDNDDPLAFVHSMDMRRDITTGQRAMLYASRFPDPKKLKRKSGSSDPNISRPRISEARTLLKNELDADLVADVLNGVTRLDNAVKKAKTREIERGSDAAKLAELHGRHPDFGCSGRGKWKRRSRTRRRRLTKRAASFNVVVGVGT